MYIEVNFLFCYFYMISVPFLHSYNTFHNHIYKVDKEKHIAIHVHNEVFPLGLICKHAIYKLIHVCMYII